ncbi:hypothetical protein PENTCL1PPCAC_6365 [Pristionchus entomophagus]|uniref:Mediator of RNA polymerase II transcription subunit 4 n=1 Tax=Pristionchus entomophagus TaxID=358040 RepID=A0AAV5SNN6_9BILA|nr:hypothetical protein PENTCL1PPCAC_6365 [Pristionchus entomophagus]
MAKDENRSLAECAQECSQDITAISKQILEFMLDRERVKRGSKEKLIELLILFEQKLDRMKRLVQISPEYREREELIAQLQKCVDNRDEIIQSYADNLRGAEQVLTKGIFQANKKLKNMAESEANPVYSEDVIKFAHQISKSYSVAAPQFWQQGDPSRPFPTEHELRQSSIASAKNSIGPLPNQSNLPSSRSSQFPPRLTSSPAHYGSPRTSVSTASQSPRGRMNQGGGGGTPSGSSMGGCTPWRQEVSPFTLKKTEPSPKRSGQPPTIAKQADQIMSSDSSSSSSSEEEN